MSIWMVHEEEFSASMLLPPSDTVWPLVRSSFEDQFRSDCLLAQTHSAPRMKKVTIA